ncbi:MAG TPA: hypothetical protein VF510_00885 [Ktedonobacterales bacterium]
MWPQLRPPSGHLPATFRPPTGILPYLLPVEELGAKLRPDFVVAGKPPSVAGFNRLLPSGNISGKNSGKKTAISSARKTATHRPRSGHFTRRTIPSPRRGDVITTRFARVNNEKTSKL